MESINPVGWFEIYVNDLDKAKNFYEKVFDVELTELSNPDENDSSKMLAFPIHQEKPNATGALVKMDGMNPGPGGTLVYFSCEDCANEEKRAGENGGNVVQSKMSIGEYGFISLINDTEGNIIGLHSQK